MTHSPEFNFNAARVIKLYLYSVKLRCAHFINPVPVVDFNWLIWLYKYDAPIMTDFIKRKMDIFREYWVPEGTYATPGYMHGIRVVSRVELPKYADCPENSVFEVMGFRKPSLSTGMEGILEDTKYGSFFIWDIDELIPCS